MKNMLSKKSLVLSLITCFMVMSAVSFASNTERPKPPKELLEIMNELIKFEDNLRNDHWEKAGDDIAIIAKDFKIIKDNLSHVVSAQVIGQFEEDIHHFENDIKTHDVKDIEKSLVDIQHLLLDIMDHYEYRYAPIYMFMLRYLEEMEEELAHHKFDIIIAEMHEFEAYEAALTKQFKQDNLDEKEIKEFLSVAHEVIKHCKAKDTAHVKAELKRMEAIIHDAEKLEDEHHGTD